MLEIAQNNSFDSNSEWVERSEYWIAESAKPKRKRKVRERNSNPLILTGHGTSLRIEKGTLLIRQGFTHYPQKAQQFRYFKGDLELPRIIILLDGSGTISFEVLNWLGTQGVALARIKWDGTSAIVATGAGFSSNAEKLRWQYELQSNEAKRIEFAKELIARKLLNCAETLQLQFQQSERRDKAIGKSKEGASLLKAGDFTDMQEIRAVEGQSASAYFSVWAEIEMQWKAITRYPIPDNWRTYRSRSSVLTGKKAMNYKASHPINAMVNYAYAVKAAQLEIEAVIDGCDPYAGIMHHPRRGFAAYAYDLIEPERPNVDAAVLEFAQSRTFTGADFILRNDGVCRLSPQLARAIATLI